MTMDKGLAIIFGKWYNIKAIRTPVFLWIGAFIERCP